MTPSDVSAALLIAEGLGACARMAVEQRVTEQTYLELARAQYRRIAGAPREGRPPMVDGWTPLIEACGGVGELADELGVTRRTLARWRSGATTIPRERRAKVREMARRRGVAAPVFSAAAG